MGKYEPLASHLASRPEATVRLTFTEIETILGSLLPASARNDSASTWWSNSKTNDSHTWAHLWQRAGWEKTALNPDEGWVVFRRRDPAMQYFAPGTDAPAAVEGKRIERTVLAATRCRALAKERRRRDGYTCTACGFFLEHEGGHVVEVHHLDPVSRGERTTTIDDLVSLCPTCHSVAHLRAPPYLPDEIALLTARRPS